MADEAASAELIEDAAGLERLVERIGEEPVYAMDTEFHRERTYFAQLALVQIGWDGHVALVDPLEVDLEPLAELFARPSVAVMHAARQDIEVLERSCGRVPECIVDTQLAAGFLGYTAPSLSALVERELGVRLPKADRLTDWLRRPLSDAQLTYAASDVAHLVQVYHRLDERLRERNRLAWLDEAMTELLDEPRGAREPTEAWRRIKEVRHLRGRDLAVAKAVAAWREERAIELDVTPRFVLSDLGVVGVAASKPGTIEELRQIRGVDGRALRSGSAQDLVDLVARAVANPPRSQPGPGHPELPAELRPAVPLVSAWVSQLARDLEIELALLATRADLEDLLRGDPNARLATGWRAELVGEPVRRLVDGEVALAFDRAGGLVLEPRSGASGRSGASFGGSTRGGGSIDSSPTPQAPGAET
ncbi:MAG TPA: HRDC domain-containing protein [Microthrixaceae bacterium]|nr:HRDC domain-containing protein [Microthrixaceae bacterium]